MTEHTVVGTRVTGARAEVRLGESVAITLATGVEGSAAALAPVDLVLAGIAGALIGGAESAAATLSFHFTGAVVRVCGRYHDSAPLALAVDYDLALTTDEPDARFVRFHELLRGSESMHRLGAAGTALTGRLRRDPDMAAPRPAPRPAPRDVRRARVGQP